MKKIALLVLLIGQVFQVSSKEILKYSLNDEGDLIIEIVIEDICVSVDYKTGSIENIGIVLQNSIHFYTNNEIYLNKAGNIFYRNGKIDRIGDMNFYYRNGKIDKIGDVNFYYRNGNIDKIGGVNFYYRNGKIDRIE